MVHGGGDSRRQRFFFKIKVLITLNKIILKTKTEKKFKTKLPEKFSIIVFNTNYIKQIINPEKSRG